MKKNKEELKKLRVLGRLMANEVPKEVLEQASGGFPPKVTRSIIPPGETPDTGP